MRVTLLPVEDPSRRVAASGAVGSVEAAEVTVPSGEFESLWRPEFLERLARAYWRHLGTVSLGLIKVVYRRDSRTVVLIAEPLTLLRFHAPEYETGLGHGLVRWRIDRGLLVARRGRGRGHLSIEVRREDQPAGVGMQTVRVRVEVTNFYPLIRGGGRFAAIGGWVYERTQLRIHRWVTYGFLRSLAALDLPPSEIGALRSEIRAS